jgi:hypothetical protein
MLSSKQDSPNLKHYQKKSITPPNPINPENPKILLHDSFGAIYRP